MVESEQGTIAQMCRENHVLKLELFGSATLPRFDPENSDLDFIVTFEDLEPAVYADAYFGFKECLERLFQRPVDVVVESTLKNPYFLQEVRKTKTLLYAA